MQDITTVEVVDFPTPSAPPSVVNPLYDAIDVMATPKKTPLINPNHASHGLNHVLNPLISMNWSHAPHEAQNDATGRKERIMEIAPVAQELHQCRHNLRQP